MICINIHSHSKCKYNFFMKIFTEDFGLSSDFIIYFFFEKFIFLMEITIERQRILHSLRMSKFLMKLFFT